MMALAGAPLGLRFLVMDTVADACAGQFAPMIVGDWRDENALAEFARMTGRGVRFTMEPTSMGPTTIAVFDDTCGNLIQLVQV